MRGRLRHRYRPQGQYQATFKQERFDGGLNADTIASKLNDNELAVLENAVPYPDHMEGRSGSKRYHGTPFSFPDANFLAASGSYIPVRNWKQNTNTGLVLIQEVRAWLAESNLEVMTVLKAMTLDRIQVSSATGGGIDVAGGFGGSSTYGYFFHISNTNFVEDLRQLYYAVTNPSGSTYTLTIYRDAARQNSVATGSRTGAGILILEQTNNSGLGGVQAITGVVSTGVISFSSVAEDANPGYYLHTSFNTRSDFSTTKIVPYKNDFLVFGKNRNGGPQLLYVDSQKKKIFPICDDAPQGYGSTPIKSAGSQGSSTPYGRRYIYTFCRIEDSNGNNDSSLDRTTGNLVYEGPANEGEPAEHWVASAISSSAANTVSMVDDWLLTIEEQLGSKSLGHYTHYGVYACLDIGVNGTDPVTGEGNNREIFIWLKDVEITAEDFSDDVSDAVLRSRLATGSFGLNTRFWREIPGLSHVENSRQNAELAALGTTFYNSLIGDTTSEFLFCAYRGHKRVFYSQFANTRHFGYQSSLQVFDVEDGITEIKRVGENVAIICKSKTYLVNPKVYSQVTGVESIFLLTSIVPVSETIGVTDIGSIADVDDTMFIAHCNDNTVRLFTGQGWDTVDLAGRKVSADIAAIVDTTHGTGSCSAYFKGAYYLKYGASVWRLALKPEAGSGWTKYTGGAQPSTMPFYMGVVESGGKRKLLSMDAHTVSSNYYNIARWVETFSDRSNAVYKDNVDYNGNGGTSIVAKFRAKELTGAEESQTVIHEESHLYLRPSASAYVSGMEITARAYVDGSATEAGEEKDVSQSGGDIQYFDRIRGKRIQQEYEISESGFKVVGHDTHFQIQDTKSVGDGPAESDSGDYQLELASNLKHWLTRPSISKNRANGTDYTVTGESPEAVTGPDGKEYAIYWQGGV